MNIGLISWITAVKRAVTSDLSGIYSTDKFSITKEALLCFVLFPCVSQRMQLDIILTSLQDHTHVASLLGYSSPTDAPEVPPSGTGFTASPDPAYGTTTGHPDTHLAEILMKTLLRNLGFYTVSTWHKS